MLFGHEDILGQPLHNLIVSRLVDESIGQKVVLISETLLELFDLSPVVLGLYEIDFRLANNLSLI